MSHFLGELGMHVAHDGDLTVGWAAVSPEMCVPGSARPRIGLLATLVDVVSGQPPGGAVNPTVDLRVQVVRTPPTREVRAVCRVLKMGRTLMFSEGELFADDDPEPFASATSTFMSRRIVTPGGPMSPAGGPLGVPIAERIGAQELEPGVVVVGRRADLVNGPGGTIQGGVVAIAGELAAESLLAQRGIFAVDDLDVRYMSRLKEGPLRAGAEIFADDDGVVLVRVMLTDVSDDRHVARVTATCRPLAG